MAVLTGHSCLGKVLDRAQDCRVKKLALVHTSPYGNVRDPIKLPDKPLRDIQVVVPNDLDELEF
jgi:ribonuclease BN (tRNA processing enzyme)